MSINRLQVILASIVLLGSALLAKELEPRELMARTRPKLDLAQMVPAKFGPWTVAPDISPVTPSEPEGYVEPDPYSKIYSQELARGYTDGRGNVVMLLVAYGPVQNYRLKAHRPEMCYTAAGFKITGKTDTSLAFSPKAPPLAMTRMVAEREARLEPISYWMRVGDDVSNGVIQRQAIRLKYGLKGLIPDGALIRVSTIGLPRDASFKVQDEFIKDLLASIPPEQLKFFIGHSS